MLKLKLFFLWGLLIIQTARQKALSIFFLLHATISHFSSTACHTFSRSTQGQNEFQSWIMASNEIIPKWHCEIAGWEKVPLVSRLILFAHLSLICWSHTLSRRSGAALYICLRCAGWWQGVKSAVWELSDVPVCASVAVTWDTSCLSHLSFLRTVKGGQWGGGEKRANKEAMATHRLNLCHRSAPVSAHESNQDEWGLSRPAGGSPHWAQFHQLQ